MFQARGWKRETEEEGSAVRVGTTFGVSAAEGAGGEVSATEGLVLLVRFGFGDSGDSEAAESESAPSSPLNHCHRLAWKAVEVMVIGSGAWVHPEPTASE